MRLLAWGFTDVGRKRDHNEDSFLVSRELGLFVVADGMGGHAGGDRASRMAVETIERVVGRTDLDTPSAMSPEVEAAVEAQSLPLPARVLRGALVAAGGAIYQAALDEPTLTGMGTTVTALLLHGDRAHLAHVGDSRAYRYRDGVCEQITEDHSWIREQVKAGLLTEEEARESRFRHIITRSVGFDREVAVDVVGVPVLAGDCFVLCSDGLSNYIEADEIGRFLRTYYYSRVPQMLIDLACDRGGDDNVTVVLVCAANHAGG
jgi:protein phosphatase